MVVTKDTKYVCTSYRVYILIDKHKHNYGNRNRVGILQSQAVKIGICIGYEGV